MPVRKAARRDRKPERRDLDADAPELEQLDWDAVRNAEFVADSAPQNADLRNRSNNGERSPEAPEEDDDNPYQESDEALPDDDEERAIRDRNKARS